jgi:hypothetical protein
VSQGSSKILFTVTVDTEEEWDWNSGWPRRDFGLTNIGHLHRFQDLCSRYNIAATYFTDLAVLEDRPSRDVMLDISRRPRVEVGMHIHPWNTPPFESEAPCTARTSFLHNHSPEVIRAKLNTVYGQFSSLGLRPSSFRGGRYSSGPVTQEFLREKGFWADASVVPYTTWPDDGAPDYRDRDLQPRRIARPDAACTEGLPGSMPRRPNHPDPNQSAVDAKPVLWEVPLTLAFTRRPFHFWRRMYEKVEHSWFSKLHLIGIWERLGLVRKSWLNFESSLGFRMLSFLHILRSMQIPCINFTLHSSSLVAGLNPFTPTAADQARLTDQAEGIFEFISGCPDFQSCTMTEVAQELERRATVSAALM